MSRINHNEFVNDNIYKHGCYVVAKDTIKGTYYKVGFQGGTSRIANYPNEVEGLDFINTVDVFDDGEKHNNWDKLIHKHLKDVYDMEFDTGVAFGNDEEWCHFPKYEKNDDEFVKIVHHSKYFIRTGIIPEKQRIYDYPLIKHSKDCIDKGVKAFDKGYLKFLIAIKCRGYKTCTSLHLAVKLIEERNLEKKILVLTYKPNDTVGEFAETVLQHLFMNGWAFCTKDNEKTTYTEFKKLVDKYVVFASFQCMDDEKESEFVKFIKNTNWGVVIVDEDHFGADKVNGRDIINGLNKQFTLHLTGTPSYQIVNNEFEKDEMYMYTYTMEQKYHKDDVEGYGDVLTREIYNICLDVILKKMVEKTGKSITPAELYRTDEKGFVHLDDIIDLWKLLRGCVKRSPEFMELSPKVQKSIRDIGVIEKFNLKHIMVQLPTRICSEYKEPVTELYKVLSSLDCYKDFVIIPLTGSESEIEKSKECEKIMMDNDKTICITYYKGTVGVTLKPLDSVFVFTGSDGTTGSDAYLQVIDRPGSPYGDKKVYRIFDFNFNRCLEIPMHEAALLAAANNTSIANELEEVMNYTSIYNYEGVGFELMSDCEEITRRYYSKLSEISVENSIINYLSSDCTLSEKFETPKTIETGTEGVGKLDKKSNNSKSSKQPNKKKDSTNDGRRNYAKFIIDSLKPVYIYDASEDIEFNITSFVNGFNDSDCRDFIKSWYSEEKKNICDSTLDSVYSELVNNTFIYELVFNLISVFYYKKSFEELFYGKSTGSGNITPEVLVNNMLLKI